MPRNDLPAPLAALVARAFGPDVPARPTVLAQEGEMRLRQDGPFMPFTAEQRFTLDPGGFVWHARVKMAPLVTAVVEDAYEDGVGRLDAKVWGLLPVAKGRGVDVDRGEAERYLAELAWNPAAFVHDPGLRFAEGPGGATRIWTHDPETRVDVVIDEEADAITVTSDTRAREEGPAPWGGRLWETHDFGALRAPRRAEVWWDLPEGRFVYFRCEVTELDFVG